MILRLPYLQGEELQQESARILMLLGTLTPLELEYVPVWQLAKIFKAKLSRSQLTALRKRYKAGVRAMGKTTTVEKPTVNPAHIEPLIVIEDIATILGKSFAVLGENEELGSEDALRLITKRVKKHDPSIIERNLKRRLPK